MGKVWQWGGPLAAMLAVYGGSAAPVAASEVLLTGKVVETQGHVQPRCRMLGLRAEGAGAIHWFRLPDTGNDNSILAVAMSAQATGSDVVVSYDPAIGSGCGTEPVLNYIAMRTWKWTPRLNAGRWRSRGVPQGKLFCPLLGQS